MSTISIGAPVSESIFPEFSIPNDIGDRAGIDKIRTYIHDNFSRDLRVSMIHDPRFFFLYYLGFRQPPHQQFWTSYFNRMILLVLAPRDHGKTWTWVYGHMLWRIYKDLVENDFQQVLFRGLIISKTEPQAIQDMRPIKETIEKNPYLLEDFGDIRGPKWQDTYFICRRRAISALAPEKEPTLEVTGVTGGITGGHFRVIILDDILDDENTKTADRLNGIRNWFNGTVWNLREPNTQIFMIGTRKTARDLYQDTTDNPLWEKITSTQQAIIQYPLLPDGKPGYRYTENQFGLITDVEILAKNWKVLWDESQRLDEFGKPIIDSVTKQPMVLGWGIKRLLLDRANSQTTFDREKQNTISSEGGQILKAEWLQYFPTMKLEIGPGGVIVDH